MNDHPIILFDGVCNLCNGVVRFIIERDRKGVFRFASLQSSFGKSVLKKFNLPPDNYTSFILLDKDRLYLKSSAALRITRYLPRTWFLLQLLLFIPPFIRNAVYDFVATHRYKWFGKQDECMLPSPEIKSRFFN